MVKKIAIAVWIITAFFFGILLVNYIANKNLIKKYGQGIYQQNEYGALGFTQPTSTTTTEVMSTTSSAFIRKPRKNTTRH